VELPHLRGLRQLAVLSQEQLAERSGVARDTISKLETVQRRAYPATVRKLAVGLEAEQKLRLGAAEYSAAGPDENSLDKGYLEEPEDGKKVGF
jgi:transcriptional regulator with XRE-family HTH domain